MAVYKRGEKGTYWFEFVFNNRRIRESTHQTNQRVARQIESAKRTQLAESEVGIKEPKPSPSFKDFSKRFLKWVAVEKADKPRTVQFYQDRVNQLLKFDLLKSCVLDDIDEEFVAKYVEWRWGTTRTRAGKRAKKTVQLVDTGRPVSIASVNRDLATLRHILNVGREWKLVSIPPKIRLLSGETTHDRVLSHDEEEAYLLAASPLLRDCAVIALDSGMRPTEILRMRFENVKFDPAGSARYGYIHNPDGKTKRAKRNLPMTSRVREVLERLHKEAGKVRWGWVWAGKKGEHVTYDTINCQHDRVMKKLSTKFKSWRLYDMRHTYLTRLGESGADAFTIMKLAGHASIVTSERYVHPTPERIEDAVSRLEVYNGGKQNAVKAI